MLPLKSVALSININEIVFLWLYQSTTHPYIQNKLSCKDLAEETLTVNNPDACVCRINNLLSCFPWLNPSLGLYWKRPQTPQICDDIRGPPFRDDATSTTTWRTLESRHGLRGTNVTFPQEI